MENSMIERLRLQILAETGALDDESEKTFQDIVGLGTTLIGAPICAVSFVGLNQQWIKAAVGLDFCELARGESFCARVVESGRPIVVPNMRLDDRMKDHRMVTGSPFIQFYAGFPVKRNSHTIGTICIMDFQPRFLTPEQCASLQALADLVGERLEAQVHLAQLRTVTKNTPGMLSTIISQPDGNSYYSYVSAGSEDLLGLKPEALLGRTTREIIRVHEDDAASLEASRAASRGSAHFFWEGRLRILDGSIKWVRIVSSQTSRKNGDAVFDGIMIDITREKELERDIALERQRANNAVKLAALASMAGGIAHEVKNPLAMVQLLADELAVSGQSLESANETREQINGMIKRISKIVNGLHLLSAAAEPHQPGVVDASLLGAMLTTEAHEAARAARCVLEVSAIPDAKIVCETSKLTQIFIMLLGLRIDGFSTQTSPILKLNFDCSGGVFTIAIGSPAMAEAAEFPEHQRLLHQFARDVLEAVGGSLDTDSLHTTSIKIPIAA